MLVSVDVFVVVDPDVPDVPVPDPEVPDVVPEDVGVTVDVAATAAVHFPLLTHLLTNDPVASLIAFPVKSDLNCQCPAPANHPNSSKALAVHAPRSV